MSSPAFTPRPTGAEERLDKWRLKISFRRRKRETANNGRVRVVRAFVYRHISAVARRPHGRPVRRNKAVVAFGDGNINGTHRRLLDITSERDKDAAVLLSLPYVRSRTKKEKRIGGPRRAFCFPSPFSRHCIVNDATIAYAGREVDTRLFNSTFGESTRGPVRLTDRDRLERHTGIIRPREATRTLFVSYLMTRRRNHLSFIQRRPLECQTSRYRVRFKIRTRARCTRQI